MTDQYDAYSRVLDKPTVNNGEELNIPFGSFSTATCSTKFKYRLITFGRTHNPDQFEQDDLWFYNTGTWIPILEVTSADVRNDKTYTYLHIRPGAAGENYDSSLKRWNDDGGPGEASIVINKN
jgi:hypothetical protein